MAKRSGQGLAEYGIIITLVALVGLAGLVLLGGGIKDSMNELLVSNTASNQGESEPPGINDPPPAPVPAPTTSFPPMGQTTPPSAPPGAPGPVNLTLADGTIINLNAPTTDAKSSVETLGANGTTKLMAKSLEELAAKLVASGQLEPTEGDLMMKLANQMHRMADLEKAIEDHGQKYAGDRNAFLNSPITWDGKTYANPQELSTLIGGTGQGEAFMGLELKEMWAINSDVYGILWDKDPAIQQLVGYFSASSNDISYQMRVAIDNMITYNVQTPPENISDAVASLMTNSNGAGVCNLSSGSDSGVHCASKT